MVVMHFFFFQAEDGIRDRNVTGVQTCALPIYFHQTEVCKTIDQSARCHFTNAPKIIGVNVIDIAPGKLLRAIGHAIEHLINPTEVVNGTEDEIEPLPILLDPFSSSRARFRVVIKLNPGANLYVRILFTQTIEFIEIDASMITIVIGEGDINDSFGPRRIDPRLQKRLSVILDPVALRVGVIIAEQNWSNGWSVVGNHYSFTPLPRRYGAVMNFCRVRSSGYLGKKTSTL